MKRFEAAVEDKDILRFLQNYCDKREFAYKIYTASGGSNLIVAYDTLEELKQKEAGR